MLFTGTFQSALKKILIDTKPKKILLVSGNKSFIQVSDFFNLLKKELSLTHITDLEDFPSKFKLAKITQKISSNNYDLLIAIGGGKIIDYGKLIALQLSNNSEGINLIGSNNPSTIPIIAIPTTAGSGSEATSFAVLYENKVKYSIDCESLRPLASILDYKLILNLNKRQLSISAMDALCQGLESVWSINSNEKSLIYSDISLKLTVPHILEFINSDSIQVKKSFFLGSHYAGKAINISKTTAPHALSYFLTQYHKIPHGEAVGIFILPFLKFNFPLMNKKRKAIILNAFDSNSIHEIIEKLGNIKSSLSLRFNLNEVKDLNDKDLLKNVNIQRLSNNPGNLNDQKLKKILEII